MGMNLLPIHVQFLLKSLGEVPPVINGWLKEAAAQGGEADDMAMAMVESGCPLEVSSFLAHLAKMGLFLTTADKGAVDERLVPRSQQGSPRVPHAQKHVLDLGDRLVQCVLSVGNPDLVLYDNFISDEECEFLKSTVNNRMQRSYVVGKGFTNTSSGARTSSGAFLHPDSHPLICSVEKRIAQLTGIPASRGEGLQVLHYENAEEYQPHFDFFEAGTADEARMLEAPGNRVGTMILYLNDVEEGGATYFPRLDLAVHPRKGSAVWFGYMGKDGVLDQRTEHAGLPVIKGHKWIATKWLRERDMPRVPRNGDDLVMENSPPQPSY